MRPYDITAAGEESTRDRLLRAASALFARHGFRGVGIRDIASGADVSGAAIYKHFKNKQEILAELLVGISEYLLDNALELQQEHKGRPPETQLRRLIEFHVGFALGYRDLILIQYRDLDSLQEQPRRRVRDLQRQYLDVWAGVLATIHPRLQLPSHRARAQACFGLINSAAHQAPGTPGLERLLTDMGEACLSVVPR
ncbi:TetR/AcrR family transcriptional regulator [Nitriliruptor alkaliphilus]|uniref:TetR/AcrR family transcriptional regulator n=1 Tax=Nitriliruptor alkaliphilus TaxID=427918 RepID=UPI0006982405|nr:TetR/AcrR family transcriptional regulator [Nitriliruptor alkaliphilus]